MMSPPVAKYAIRRERHRRKKFHAHTDMCGDVAVLRLSPSISEGTVSKLLGVLTIHTLDIDKDQIKIG